MNWLECNSYWLSTNAQGTDAWLKDRLGRITMSKMGAVLNHSDSCLPDKAAKIIAGVMKEEFSDKTLAVMNHGTVHEPKARQWYEQQTGYTVVERGMAVPKWNPYLGASVDGEVIADQNCQPTTDGIIEIKCPQRMYWQLTDRVKRINQGYTFDVYDHSHIFDSHYDQMQGCMAVLNKKWCDYIVYSTNDNTIHAERVPFNLTYWQDYYPTIVEFIDQQLKPLLSFTPALPPSYQTIPYPY